VCRCPCYNKRSYFNWCVTEEWSRDCSLRWCATREYLATGEAIPLHLYIPGLVPVDPSLDQFVQLTNCSSTISEVDLRT